MTTTLTIACPDGRILNTPAGYHFSRVDVTTLAVGSEIPARKLDSFTGEIVAQVRCKVIECNTRIKTGPAGVANRITATIEIP